MAMHLIPVTAAIRTIKSDTKSKDFAVRHLTIILPYIAYTMDRPITWNDEF